MVVTKGGHLGWWSLRVVVPYGGHLVVTFGGHLGWWSLRVVVT